MFFFNLSLPEFLGLLTAASAVVVALYLLDRSRRVIVVSTLRFWQGTDRQVEASRRRKITQWPSLLLQLLAIALLLLAIAQLRFGARDTTSLDHVLLVDTSAWMAAQPAGERPLMDQARAVALGYINALPPTDRVMVVYADGLATPATGFESRRDPARQAVQRARASASSLHLNDALRFATQALAKARRPGEIVLAGGVRPFGEALPDRLPRNFRLLEVKGAPRNVGIRRIGLRPADDAGNVWHILVTLANQSDTPRTAALGLNFGGTPVTSRQVTIPAGGNADAAFDYTTGATGILEARITPDGRDDLESDNTAAVEVPGLKSIAVTVCSDQPRLLQAVLDSLPAAQPTYKTLPECKAQPPSGVAVYDGMVPAPSAMAIVIAPPQAESPVPVNSAVRNAKLTSWRPDHPLTAGLRSENDTIENTLVFRPGPDDLALAETPAGTVAVARATQGARQVYLGFHPLRSSLRYQVAAPLLFANALRWLAPEGFDRHELVAAGVGMAVTNVGEDASVKVLDERGAAVPYSRKGGEVRFFTPARGRVRVVRTVGAQTSEQVFSMALPDVPDKPWEAPANVLHGIPPRRGALTGGRDIWYWLALAAGALLLIDWLLFAPGVRRLATAPITNFLRRAA